MKPREIDQASSQVVETFAVNSALARGSSSAMSIGAIRASSGLGWPTAHCQETRGPLICRRANEARTIFVAPHSHPGDERECLTGLVYCFACMATARGNRMLFSR